MKIVLRTLILASLLVLSGEHALAHSGGEKPLFVSTDGIDTGQCIDPLNPCRSLAYALKVAGKGSAIRVASGTYPIEDPEDLFHIVSGVMQVTGGYERAEHYARAGSGVSILTGVPVEFRELLRSRGFHVISDRKGIDDDESSKALQLLDLHERLKSSLPATPCSNGSAAGLACDSIDLLAHMAFQDFSASPTEANDVWGFVDLNTNREYVIAGYNIGTAVVDVTDPERPREVGFIDGQDAIWRDIKVLQTFDAIANRWQAYAYVTTDGSTDGLFVIDLTRLPHGISRAPYNSDYFSAHNVYAGGIDFSTGIPLSGSDPYLIIAGSNISGGQYRMYSLSNPESPVFVGGASSSADYMHDGASVVVTDSRKDTQCVNAGDSCELLLDFNESTVDLWDISAPTNPRRLSRTPYANSGYTHSGWPSEDGQYVFVHDELDERNFGLRTTVRVFNIGNLAAPVLAGTWTGSTFAIDHNGFVRGNRYYIANYSRGLTVLDITNPAVPVEVGRLDTYPTDSTSFVGAWGTYPYLHSRTVAINDINSGLYLAADRTLDVPQGSLRFANSSFAATEGQQASLTVQRTGGSTGAISVQYQVIPATATADDYVLQSGTLSWNAGNIADQSIAISTVGDGVNEGLERLLIRLVSPSGGATLGDIATASLYIGDPGAAVEIAFAESTLGIPERGFGTAVVVLKRSGSAAGAVSVDYSMTGGDAGNPADFSGQTSGAVTWASGDADPKWLEFAIVDDGVNEATEFFELSLNNVSGASVAGAATVRINIENGTGVNQAPNAVAGASQSVASGAQVTLNGAASNDPNGDTLSYAWQQTGGPAVTLTNADTAVARFTAPSVQSDILLQFRLTVRDPAGLSDIANTTVTALSAGGDFGSSGGGGMGIPFLCLLGLMSLLARVHAAGRFVSTIRQSKGWRRIIVCSRSGPVEMMSSGTATSFSIRAR